MNDLSGTRAWVRTVERIGWVLIALLFIWAGISKISFPYDFFESIHAYRLPIHREVALVVARCLPILEVLCGLAFFVPSWRGTAQWTLFGLGVVFLVVTGQAWFRGLDISCGCFDVGPFARWMELDFESARFALVRNTVLCLFCGFSLFRARSVTGV